MAVDSKIVVSCTSRLFTDEVCKLQEKVGCIVPLRDSHGSQNLQTVGLKPALGIDLGSDYVLMCNYLSTCTLAILEEVTTDSLVLTKISRNGTYQIKNKYHPFFQWDSNIQVCVMPPLFDQESNSVDLQSNNFTLLLPIVVPCEVAHEALQKVLTYNIYLRVTQAEPNAARMADVLAQTNYVTYLGNHYSLNLEGMESLGALAFLDNLATYLCIMVGLLPRACVRLLTTLLRHGENELLNVFRRMIPDEFNAAAANLNADTVYPDMTKIGLLITYLQTLGSIFNLSPRLQVSTYTPENLSATCWYVC
ncbi:minor capsid protein [Alcelaphine gammaherpesvirus 1]|uniref:Triplex capsid protein 2 n=1 Tax=Alcelaphine herpesvirus 1 (strain C500) TaxID=654901 RepID=TRX2_ALHV1|nr:minor capsid protein [Alcelaphine gammaherpesvirus 1]O36376.1 RecName: Full=Triplex capsid protein 2 [Alcelaphine herpesvirus 1 strain C500]AAC58073.1 minor capsid protein [Alcelaphine gammaherpesvirus 1]APB09452.1 capsid triplex subunit 2 [Alcelaphine gammaherpesvirus 1]APB09524.1 capsid triplex subunit 2 [Alcelaphine gammaherpesvirus 1]ATI21914.1 ORF26 [Alcelaphine gammaherpesvirus 1]QDY92259.1 capsid triplex subunit 2 [Alcelaphine gammaherpesvirus 1]